MIPTQKILRPAGRSAGYSCAVLEPTDEGELFDVLKFLREEGACAVPVGARRSFGTQFLPSRLKNGKSYGLDLTGLPKKIDRLSETDDGLWIRASGWCRFSDLLTQFPGYLPLDPPTSPQVTLAGALVAACHSSSGYFPDHVRRFSLVTAEGNQVDCSAHCSEEELAGQLFRMVPGSYGALGLVTEIELFLRKTREEEFIDVEVLESGGRGELRAVLERLETTYQGNECPPGRGLYMKGAGERLVLLGDRYRNGRRPAKGLPLSSGSEASNIFLQGVSNRFPRVSQFFQTFRMKKGTHYAVEMDRFKYFQSSYDAAASWLGSPRIFARMLRGIGVVPELPVVHQTWVIHPENVEGTLQLWFDMLRESPARRFIELQDLIRLPRARTPMHPASLCEDGALLFTSSAAARTELARRSVVELFRRFSREAYFQKGTVVLLLKQVHVEEDLLGAMHSPHWRPLWRLKSVVDPHDVLSSDFLERVRKITSPVSNAPGGESAPR